MELERAVELFKQNIRLIGAYDHAMGVMSYDSDTAAPKNASAGFGKTMGILSEIQYNLLVNDENFEVVDTLLANKDSLDAITRRQVEEVELQLREMRCLSVEEYSAFVVLLSDAKAKWLEAKQKSDYSIFEPCLAKIVEYNRKIASLIAPEKSAYDYCLDHFERGLNTETLDAFFAKLRNDIVPLIKKIKDKGNIIDTSFIERPYPIELQRKFSDRIIEVMTISRDDCAIGETEHPFTTNFNKHDVRITTHYHENSVASSMYSVIHEGGHALYELHTGDELDGTMLAGGASMSIHESQSRFFENIIGRSEEFIGVIFPILKEIFPEQLADVDPHAFFLAVNKAEPSLIRTEADELTYSMHIMIRYELEKRLMDGSLSTKELPAEWNRLYKEYLGVDVPDDSSGVLQDSHWSGGSIGYFSSYALGSAYSAQIFDSMKRDIPVMELVKKGELAPIVEWLTEKIYKYGMLLRPDELILNSCGKPFDPQYYVDYLTEKFAKIYDL